MGGCWFGMWVGESGGPEYLVGIQWDDGAGASVCVDMEDFNCPVHIGAEISAYHHTMNRHFCPSDISHSSTTRKKIIPQREREE